MLRTCLSDESLVRDQYLKARLLNFKLRISAEVANFKYVINFFSPSIDNQKSHFFFFFLLFHS